jgi:hypothetical protein
MASLSPNGHLGIVTEGSFTGGLTVRLDNPSVEELQVGSFVVVEGERRRYFSLISDLQLRVTDPAVAADPPVGSDFVRQALHGIQSYASAVVRPSLVIDEVGSLDGDPRPRAVRTIPPHFAAMRQARDEDFDLVFGSESDERFALGSPIAMDHVNVPIDLVRLVERSNGIFGQTGTGKSVLARLLLFGLIRSRLASTLVFDMHDEYADGDPKKPHIPGLRSFFDSTAIKVYNVDPRKGGSETQIVIGMNQIEPGDIELLRGELNLNPTFSATSYALRKRYQERWLQELLERDLEDLAEPEAGDHLHPGTLEALRRQLRYLESAAYIRPYTQANPVRDIVGHLEQGRNVVVQFGGFSNLRDYMLVANLLTRRIHEQYTERVIAMADNDTSVKPLVVVLEEAHKFLSPALAKQTIFGTIAREMRKFGVSLLVIDQRPSGIDDEILSQLGTRITGLLTDQADIDAVLSGTGDRSALRAMLASLEPSQQCLVVGHAIPMPMILQTRAYTRDLDRLLEQRRRSVQGMSALLAGGVRDLTSGSA